jgi:hypothetical protein
VLRFPPGIRLTWLHLRTRRVPAGILALAVCGAVLHAALHWHWVFSSGPYAQQVPMIIEAGAAAVIAVTAQRPRRVDLRERGLRGRPAAVCRPRPPHPPQRRRLAAWALTAVTT